MNPSHRLATIVVSFGLFACGADTDSADRPSHEVHRAEGSTHADPWHGTAKPGDPFAPAPPTAGYTRFTTPVMKNLAPNTNTSYCQYIQAPSDRDVDVLDVQGHQSFGGHHVVAYATPIKADVGTSRSCTDEDNLLGGFLGGIGGEAGGGVNLPPGVAFRLPKGSAIMVNTHFVNNTDKAIDGQSVIDFKFAEPSPDRLVASMFTNGYMGFKVPAKGTLDSTVDCTIARDMQFILFTNHMHEWGAKAKTEVTRADGKVELLHEDRIWSPELAFRADYTKWAKDKPLTLFKGDRVRTYCSWDNTTGADLQFPDEMCFGVGFFLSTSSSSPTCINGSWIER